MIIRATAPTRIGLFGGSTDVEPFASQYGGIVLNIGINLRAKVKVYTEDNLFDITRNVVPYLGNVDFMHKIFTHFKIGNFHHVRFESFSEALLESGLGSSAASAVATVGAINKIQNLGLSPLEIATLAWNIEVNEIGLFGGSQDQIAAALGGVNVIEYKAGGTFEATQLGKEFIDPLLPYLILFYTGGNRQSAKIQEGFKHLNKWQVESLNKIKEITISAIEAITQKDIKLVGDLFNKSWEMKKRSNEGVTTKKLDKIYAEARKVGAFGGKVMGAGGGGHMLFICPPEKQEKLINKLEKIDDVEHIDFGICWQGLEVRRL